MKTTVTKVSPSKRDIEIEIPAEEAAPAYAAVLERYAGRVKLHGFRAGKAPRDIIKRMFQDEITHALVDDLAPRALSQGLKLESLEPVMVPVIHDIKFEEGQPLRFRAYVEVWPEFELPAYTKIKVKRQEVRVEDEEVAKALEDLRHKAAEYVPAEGRGVQEGDYVVVEWKGKDTASKRLFPTEKAVVLAGHEDNDKVLNQNLLGLKPGEERQFVLEHAADHANKKVAGKRILYRMRVLNIKEKKLPALDDEFAKSLGELASLEELKDRVSRQIRESRARAARNEMAQEILKEISVRLNVEPPESLLEQEFRDLMRRRFGESVQEIEKRSSKEALAEVEAQARAQAKQKLINHLILKQIAEKERITVLAEELDRELEALAQANRIPKLRLRQSLESEGHLEGVRETVLLRKAVDFLVDQAIIIESGFSSP